SPLPPQAATGRTTGGSLGAPSSGGTAGQGSGTKRPSGNGSWRSSAISRRAQPWRNTLTSRRRVARRVRWRSGHTPVTSSNVLAGNVSSSPPPPPPSPTAAPAPPPPTRPAPARPAPPVPGASPPARDLADLNPLVNPAPHAIPSRIPGLRRQIGQNQPGVFVAVLPASQQRAGDLVTRKGDARPAPAGARTRRKGGQGPPAGCPRG